ncbi:MAG: coproporphyrinogen III oxidase [Bacteroidales bacterium]|nr:coproporphyrinogen III oxidase [Bacteroidales bacterium]
MHETRGIGGIFFDRQQPTAGFDFHRWMEFTSDLASLYPQLYHEIINFNHQKSYTNDHVKWQKIRWGRYVEFNLVYDRGTKFGLESGGNTESILISLPPEVRWEYQFKVQKDSLEDKTQQMLKKGIDWIKTDNH